MSNSAELLQEKIRKARPFSQDRMDAMRDLTIPQQLAFIRRQYGITQGEMADALGMRQGYYSRLEQTDKHLFGHYLRAATVLGWRLSLLHKTAKIATQKDRVQKTK